MKGGGSEHFSPRKILKQRNLDYNKHFKVPFGAYMQAYYEPLKKNSMVARTRDGILLRPTDTIQGGHEVLDLNTKKVISRGRVKEVPMTDLVEKTINDWGFEEGFKKLKLSNPYSKVYHDAYWIAGVDYQDDDETFEIEFLDEDDKDFDENDANEEDIEPVYDEHINDDALADITM